MRYTQVYSKCKTLLYQRCRRLYNQPINRSLLEVFGLIIREGFFSISSVNHMIFLIQFYRYYLRRITDHYTCLLLYVSVLNCSNSCMEEEGKDISCVHKVRNFLISSANCVNISSAFISKSLATASKFNQGITNRTLKTELSR